MSDCESFGSDCTCYAGCPCATCVGKGNTVADCENFGSDCSCYADPGPAPGGSGYGGACADLQDRTAAVNDECCNEKTEDCSSGRPATCNLGCAHVLLPFFDDCSGALGAAGAAQFDGVVALCHAAEAAPPVSFNTSSCSIIVRAVASASLHAALPPASQVLPIFAVSSCTVTGGGACFRSPNYPNDYDRTRTARSPSPRRAASGPLPLRRYDYVTMTGCTTMAPAPAVLLRPP